MATANVSILKNTHQEVVVKVYGVKDDTVDISLTSADLITGCSPVGSTGLISVNPGETEVGGEYLSGLIPGNSMLFDTSGNYIGVVATVIGSTGATLKEGAVTGATAAEFLVDSSATQEPSGQQKVAIAGVNWSGDSNITIDVDRGGTRILTLPAAGTIYIDFSGQDLPLETTEQTEPITVTIDGTGVGNGECWLKLRKQEGYITRIETSTFSGYDDTSKAGQ